MRKLIENIFWAGAFILTLQSAWGFVPSGPIGNNDDAWQVITIGYGWNDTVAPKDFYEEYRPVVPVMYYASDASFITYYGSSGLTNIDAAFGILNGVMCGQTNTSIFLFTPTNGITLNASGQGGGTALNLGAANSLDSYSTSLGEFPQSSVQWNYTAQTLGLLDMKSMVLHEAILELGLADPDRYVWILHDRLPNPLALKNPKCPQDVEYLVVQRNFDVTQDYPYSPYINGALYTFYIAENCGNGGGVPWTAITEPEPADTFGNGYSAVASGGLFNGGLGTGGFYTGLTSDDVMGLKYLLSTNNINWENTAPSGGLLLLTNVQPTQTLTTVPYSLLFSSMYGSTNDPATLQANYPGLTFVSVVTNIVNQVATTVTPYFTNLAGPYTNTIPLSNGVALYPSGGMVPFTNWSPVQYGAYPNYPILLTTLPLRSLLTVAPYTDPVTLLTLYPGLELGSVTTNYFVVQYTTNLFPYYTNMSVTPVFTNYLVRGLTNANYFTNQPGPTIINYDTSSPPPQTVPVSTMDLGVFSDLSKTNDPVTMQTLYPGLQILSSAYYFTNSITITYSNYLTSYAWYSQATPHTVPIATNHNWVTNWIYTFGNVYTNHYYTNRPMMVQSIYLTNYSWYSQTFSNVTTKTYYTNKISGDFFLIPTNWCGFKVMATLPLNNPAYLYGSSNTVVFNGVTNVNTATNGTVAQGLTQTFFDVYTNYNYQILPGICEPVLAWGTNYTTNIVTQYQYNFLNVVTNHYYTNSLVWLYSTNITYIPGGTPNVLATNITVTSFYTNVPDGDFYIVPPTWCGYQILPLLTNLNYSTNVPLNYSTNVAIGTNSITISNLLYSQQIYLSYTNYIYSIRPGFCEPALAFGTNYTTNVITQYSYYFSGIQTNNAFATNSPVTVITTNLVIWTNGIVGMLTNIITTNIVNNGVSGDFYIVPAGWCDYSILGTLATNVVATTTLVTASNTPGVQDLGQNYTQASISLVTNVTLLVKPSNCSQVAPVPALRRGVGRVEFIRANYDSLVGQFFQPLTNTYSMVTVTNGQQVMEYYQRVVTQPDFLFQAQDLTVPSANFPYGTAYSVTTPKFDQSAITTKLAGPGTIVPGTVIVFNKNKDNLFLNGSLANYGLTTNAFLNIGTESQLSTWGAFDGSTNYPIIYPSSASVVNLMNQMVIQITPLTVPDGTNGVAYNGGTGVTFTATGGQSPYVWSAPNLSTIVPGMSFNAATATLLGTPAAAGAFTFTVQLTDSANRVVNLNYSITIH